MSELSAADIAEGRRLAEAATPGPFAVSEDNGVFAHMQSLHRLAPGKDGWKERVASNMRSADAELLAWARNHLPALLDAAEKLAAIKELHTPDAGHDPDCDCGVPAGADQDCNECCSEWPCATIRAINTEEVVSGE